jgi:ketosteroid isomerase-like protein
MSITRRKLVMLGIAVGAVALWLAADRLIMTDKKRIRAAIGQMAAAMEKGDTEKLFAHVSTFYADETHSYMELRFLAEMVMRRYEGLSINLRDVQVKVSGVVAVAQVRVLASYPGEGTGISVWQLNFEREPDGRWLVTSLVPIRVNASDVSGWKGFYESSWE